MEIWPSIGKWGVTSLGKGFFEFAFSSFEDVQRAKLVNAQTLPNGILKLFPWIKDLIPSTLKQTSAHVWIRIHGLSQEYWRPIIPFAIASSIGTPICIDSASNKSAFERPFGNFVRILVDIDLTKELGYKILVERQGFPFLLTQSTKKIPEFCTYCNTIGHSITNCKRKEQTCGKGSTPIQKHDNNVSAHPGRKFIVGETSNANNETQLVKDNDADGVVQAQVILVDNDENIPKGIDNASINMVNDVVLLIPSSDNSQEADGSSESQYVEATRLVNFVPETQLDERHKEQVTYFLKESWDNMVDLADG